MGGISNTLGFNVGGTSNTLLFSVGGTSNTVHILRHLQAKAMCGCSFRESWLRNHREVKEFAVDFEKVWINWL